MIKRISILGSTGSIGTNCLKVIESNQDKYRVVALAAGRNSDLLKEQIEKFHPASVALLDEELAAGLKTGLRYAPLPEIVYGAEGFIRVATHEEADMIVSAMSGAAGLIPTYEAVKSGKQVALANKETMVMAGSLVMDEAQRQGVDILPIDSEHSAILQSLQGHDRTDLRRIILTASGGPFRELPVEEMADVTPEDALQHPNWDMGKKITIDSATLMNKGLEAIEAKWLFQVEMKQISIVIHPQSIVHSMVEYNDGSVVAQLGIPHMITPISYALSYPRHLETRLSPLDLVDVGCLTFEPPDPGRFRCLDLALRALEKGESMPAVLNGANEVAVDAFLRGAIGFLAIPSLIEETMEAHSPHSTDSLEKVIQADRWARDTARDILKKWHDRRS